METVPNREKLSLVGNGALLVSAPRNRAQADSLRRGKCDRAGARNTECSPEVGPPSNVTIRFKPSLIREGPLLPPVVRRCLVGSEVFQKQRTGSVAQVEAARPRGQADERAARQWRARFGARVAPGAERTTKERTGMSRQQQQQKPRKR